MSETNTQVNSIMTEMEKTNALAQQIRANVELSNHRMQNLLASVERAKAEADARQREYLELKTLVEQKLNVKIAPKTPFQAFLEQKDHAPALYDFASKINGMNNGFLDSNLKFREVNIDPRFWFGPILKSEKRIPRIFLKVLKDRLVELRKEHIIVLVDIHGRMEAEYPNPLWVSDLVVALVNERIFVDWSGPVFSKFNTFKSDNSLTLETATQWVTEE